jgi:hypothetical protein
MWREQRAASMQTKNKVTVVGIRPERWKVAGRFNMAGPVRELTAMEMDPNIPIFA